MRRNCEISAIPIHVLDIAVIVSSPAPKQSIHQIRRTICTVKSKMTSSREQPGSQALAALLPCSQSAAGPGLYFIFQELKGGRLFPSTPTSLTKQLGMLVEHSKNS